MRKNTEDTSQNLFIRVMDRLSAQHDPYKPIHSIIADTCQFFQFGCGFVYESDHKGEFSLRERYCNYSTEALREQVHFASYLGDELMTQLATRPVVFFPTRSGVGELDLKLSELFEANSLLVVSVVGNNGKTEAIVGMSDRRGRILLSGQEINVARSILTVVANHIKLRMYERKLENSQKALESMLDNMGIDIYVNDFFTHEILYVNESMAAPYGGVANLLGKKCWQALYTDKTGQCDYCPQKKIIDANGEPKKVYSWDYQRPFDGSWFRVFSSAFRWTDGRLAHVVSSADITDNKKNEAIIRRMAEYDTLTGMPNRGKLLVDLKHQLLHMTLNHREGYVLFLDLDDFKKVNDTMGHRAGDELLIRIAQYFQNNEYTKDKVYRHGGDEFVLLFPGITLEDLKKIIDTLLDRFSKPWFLEDGDARCPASIGISQFPQDGLDSEKLLHYADKAMYHAKRMGKSNAKFYSEIEEHNAPVET